MLTPLIFVGAPLQGGEPAEPAFAIQLPSAKLGYPAAEYWAEIKRPDGGRIHAFARFVNAKDWVVPFAADAAGDYRLVGVERRQGDKREPLRLGADSQTNVHVSQPGKSLARTDTKLVEAGQFETFFAAEEPWCINDHTLFQGPDESWHLIGITHPKPLDFFKDPGRRLAHATAKALDQKPWQAQPPAVTSDWEKHREYFLWAPHVIHHGDLYYMFVCAGDKATHRYPIHLLTSRDAQTWERHPGNPLVVDGFDGRDPMVLRLEDRWVMYYTATSHPDGGNHIVACVTSTNLTQWSDRRVAFVHSRAGTFGGPTESPFVVRRGDHFYLFLCDNDWTDVYLSNDPFHWNIERKAGRIHSHASEIVRDADGRWFITHAGWMSGPVSIAPLKWLDGLDNASTSIAPAAK